MYKPCLKFSALLLSGLLFVACDKDDEVKPSNEPEFPTEYSELTVEQNKEKLEENGIALIQNLTQLKSTAGIQTSISFSDFLSAAPIDNEGGRTSSGNKGLALIQSLADFGKGKKTAADVLSGFRTKEEESGSIQEMYDTIVGVYAYNNATLNWDFTEGGDKIIFKFPSTGAGTSNNAEFTIYDYKGIIKASTITGDSYTGDLPTSVKAELKVDGTKHLEYTFAASYNDNGEPTSVAITLTLGTFKFSYEVKNTTTEVSVDYGLTNGDKNIIALGAGAEGSFTGDNINNSEEVGSVVNTSSAYFQLMNIKFSGEVKVKDLEQASNASGDIHGEAQAWNDFTTLIAYYADSKKKIADTEFYGIEDNGTEQECSSFDINGDGVVNEGDCYSYEYNNDAIEVRLIFADGSKADLETYTEVGFAKLETELEEFFDSVDADLGE